MTAVLTYVLTEEEAAEYRSLVAEAEDAARAYAQDQSDAAIARSWDVADGLLMFDRALAERFHAGPGFLREAGGRIEYVYRQAEAS